MGGRRGDAEEIAGVDLIAAGDGLAVEVLVRGELAEGVVGHFLALAFRQDAGGAGKKSLNRKGAKVAKERRGFLFAACGEISSSQKNKQYQENGNGVVQSKCLIFGFSSLQCSMSVVRCSMFKEFGTTKAYGWLAGFTFVN